MEFTWSERKRALNLKEHRLDFVDAPSVFEGLTYTFEDDRFSYDEQRFITLGLLAGIPVRLNAEVRPAWARCYGVQVPCGSADLDSL